MQIRRCLNIICICAGKYIQAKTYFAYFEPMYFNFSLFWGTKVKIGFKLTSQQFTEILNVF